MTCGGRSWAGPERGSEILCVLTHGMGSTPPPPLTIVVTTGSIVVTTGSIVVMTDSIVVTTDYGGDDRLWC